MIHFNYLHYCFIILINIHIFNMMKSVTLLLDLGMDIN